MPADAYLTKENHPPQAREWIHIVLFFFKLIPRHCAVFFTAAAEVRDRRGHDRDRAANLRGGKVSPFLCSSVADGGNVF